MDPTQELLQQAHSLGEAIARHPRVTAFMAARQVVDTSAEAQALLRTYAEKAQALQAREREGQPIEVADKRALAEVETRMAGNDALKRFMRAQVDYLELMEQINRAMDEPLMGAAEQAT